jgi:carboxymethylenebutenolidase
MIKIITIVIILAWISVKQVHAQDFNGPDTVSVQSGKLILKGLLWHPMGDGPFPTIIFCHGSYRDTDNIYSPIPQISSLGPVFAHHGFIYFGLFRRGVGLSTGQGVNSSDLLDNAFKERGQEGRNEVQLQQMLTDQLQDMVSGLKYLRGRKDVDTNHMSIVGHSFGGSLTLLVAEQDLRLKAAIVFSAGGYSWNLSPELRARLIMAVKNISAPIMIIHDQNDYSITPGYALDSVLNKLNKPHILKIYPKFGETPQEGHNLIFRSIATWESDVFKFLNESLSLTH